jgi:SPP1 gp7 family putative phage head morphogenesis protein
MATATLPPELGLPRDFRPNEFLRDRTTRRFFYLEQYKNYLVQQYVGRFNLDLYPEVESRIERGMNRIRFRNLTVTVLTNEELRRVFKEIEWLVIRAFRDLEVRLDREMKRLARDEQEHERSMLAAAIPGAALAIPTVATTTQAVEQRPFYGQTTSQWLRQTADTQVRDTKQQVQIGVSQGERSEEILRRVRGTAVGRYEDGVHGRSRRHLQAALVGVVAHTAIQSRQVFRDLNILLVPRVQWTCVLDAATCLECMSWHGQIFKLDEGPRPPLHLRCRCLMIPIGPGEAAEGQTFDEWLSDQPDEIIVEALGTRRARLFQAGAIRVGDFTNSVGRTYTLKELRRKEPWAFRAAGID